MTNQRIVVVTDNMPGQINGVVTTFDNLQVQAQAHGYDMIMIDPSQFSNFAAPGYPEIRLSWPRRLCQRLRAADPQYVHIATEGPLGLAAKLCLDRHQWRYNTSYHTKFPEFLQTVYGLPTGVTYSYLRWFHSRSHTVLTTTDGMAQELKQHGFSRRVVGWSRGVDLQRLAATQPWKPRGVNEKIRVLYAGRVSWEKNLPALCQLQDQFDIVIVGDGPARQQLQSQWPRVQFVGYQQGTELANYYAASDVFAFPSLVDTFGIVMIEAMSQGTPVAAFPVTGPADVVRNGVNGVLDLCLAQAICGASQLDRQVVAQSSTEWTWTKTWHIFQQHLIKLTDNR
jgi:glycosyltransferase involved in cell wall biosynthesis